MAEKKNLVGLAKGNNNKKPNTSTIKKIVEKKETIKIISPSEERDMKAKQKVEELLQDVSLTPKKDDELLEIEETPKEGTEWLEEQVSTLSLENDTLREELSIAKEDYSKLFNKHHESNNDFNIPNNNEMKTQVIKLFNEIQEKYIELGANFMIYQPAFLNRLIVYFPFLANEKRY